MRHERRLIILMGALGILAATQLPLLAGAVLGWFSLAIIAAVFMPAKGETPPCPKPIAASTHSSTP